MYWYNKENALVIKRSWDKMLPFWMQSVQYIISNVNNLLGTVYLMRDIKFSCLKKHAPLLGKQVKNEGKVESWGKYEMDIWRINLYIEIQIIKYIVI